MVLVSGFCFTVKFHIGFLWYVIFTETVDYDVYGEYPIVIDAETILDNHIELSKQNSREIINEKIRDSVLFSGLLPNYRFSNKGKGIDMSAIMGKEGDEYPILIPRIAEIGTSNICQRQ